jgi:hypothetical protein
MIARMGPVVLHAATASAVVRQSTAFALGHQVRTSRSQFGATEAGATTSTRPSCRADAHASAWQVFPKPGWSATRHRPPARSMNATPLSWNG